MLYPVTPYDAKGLLISALEQDNPVIFFESQRCYDRVERFHAGGVPASPYAISIGEPDVKRSGEDLTILTVGEALYEAADAADALAESCFGELKIGDAAFTPYPCDGVILSAYLGSDGAKPFTKFCAAGKTVFLIARSSNKSAREVQDLLSGDRVVYQVMADLAMRWSGDLFGRNDYSQIGIVAGLTNAPVLRSLRQKYDRLFLLVPGFGTQGGAIRDTQYAFDRLGHGAAIMAGRSILYAYQKQGGDGTDFAEQARLAAEKMRTQILGYVTVL